MTTTTTGTATELDGRCIATIRTLCIDAIQSANSGHPGTPIGIAPVTYTLWQRFLRFDPADPIWPNRDRFVLSSGHASALLWSMLHLTQVQAVDPDYEVLGQRAVSLEDLKHFRQLDSKAPGHPEYRWTSGVEATTGPLGTGAATSVGMAVASQWLAARYNRDGFTMFDFDVYAQAGDGDMMEGIASEAASFASHQRLANLCWIYDSNRITIEGHTDITFTEDVAARFIAYGWNVTSVADANDLEQVERAFHDFKAEHERPTLIVVHSHIGYGSPVEDTPKAHGSPLGPEGVKATKRFLGWPEDAQFLVPDGVYEHFADGIGARGREAREAWEAHVRGISGGPSRACRRARADPAPRSSGRVGRGHPDVPGRSERDREPGLVGPGPERRRGDASRGCSAVRPTSPPRPRRDLTFEGAGDFEPDDRNGRNFHFGVREHASAAIANGLAVSKLRPFWSGFLIFSDFARGVIRLSALMEIPVVHIFTHDSIGVGEDGPTHQPVEHLVSLRAIPGLLVFRPADANEVARPGGIVLQLRQEPAVLVLSRQALPTVDRSLIGPASEVAKGAYVLIDAEGGEPDVILIATGSEVGLALSARDELAGEGIRARVVSMPCSELFDRQPQAYRDEVLPPAVKARVAIEQASTLGWHRYVGDGGAIVGMHTFGASAPLKLLVEKFGFTPDAVTGVARGLVSAK